MRAITNSIGLFLVMSAGIVASGCAAPLSGKPLPQAGKSLSSSGAVPIVQPADQPPASGAFSRHAAGAPVYDPGLREEADFLEDIEDAARRRGGTLAPPTMLHNE